MGEPRTVVVDRYPVERLPEDLRARVGEATFVKLTIALGEPVPELPPDDERPLSWYFGKLGRVHDDPVADIRKLRDEWE